MDELKAKQSKEIKEFEKNKRIALKHVKGSAGKGKKGKEKMEEAAKEWDTKHQTMLNKHKEELLVLEEKGRGEEEQEETKAKGGENNKEHKDDNHQPNSSLPPPSLAAAETPPATLTAKEKALAKRLRKKQNAIQKEKQREEEIAHEIANAPNPRQLEIDAMKELYLNPNQLQIEEIAADGNCLFRAIARQLHHLDTTNSSSSSSFQEIRKICATQLLQNRNEYEPFCDYTDSNVTSYEEYVEKVRSSNEWGGHLELRALASALEKTIVVYSADAGPLYIRSREEDDDNGGGGDDNEDGLIRLSFHRRYYALGEHYNSVVKK